MANEKKEREEELVWEVKPAKFPTLQYEYIDTSEEIAGTLGKLLAGITSEYAGGKIIPVAAPNYPPRFEFIAYFKCLNSVDSTKVKFVQQIGVKESESSIYNTLNRLKNDLKPNKYELTKEAKKILAPLTFFDRRDRNGNPIVDWNKIAIEDAGNAPGHGYVGSRASVAYMAVTLDAKMLIAKYFGPTTETGSAAEYQIVMKNKLNRPIDRPESGWLLSIQQLDLDKLKVLSAKANVIPTTNGIYMVPPAR